MARGTIRLRATEPGEVYSGAIEADSDVEILDPEVHIATVSDDVLDIEMRVKLGRGYVSAEKNFDEDLALGYIPIRLGAFPGAEGAIQRRGGALGADDGLREADRRAVDQPGRDPPRTRSA